MMRLHATVVVDGARFQPGSIAGAAWLDVLAHWVGQLSWTVHWLDRGVAPDLPGLRCWPFPSLSGPVIPGCARQSAADSALVQQLCHHVGAGVFLSTGCTTPVDTPSLVWLIGEDLQRRDEPPLADFDPVTDPDLGLALAHASSIVCATMDQRRRLVQARPTLRDKVAPHDAGRADEPNTRRQWRAAADILAHALLACSRTAQYPVTAERLTRWRALRTLQYLVSVES